MPSLVQQIFDAMPLTAVTRNMERTGANRWFDQPDKNLKSFVQIGNSGTPPPYVRPVVKALQEGAGSTGKNQQIPIWSYAPAGPSEVRDIRCSVLEDAFREYHVLSSLEWGIREDGSEFRKEFVIEYNRQRVYLPLTEEFLLCWIQTSIPGRGSYTMDSCAQSGDLFPLSAWYEPSIVYAFVYDVPMEAVEDPDAPPGDPSKKKIIPKPRALRASDPKAADQIAQNIEAFSGGSGGGSDGEGGQSKSVQDTLLNDDAWNPADERLFTEAEQPPTRVKTVPERVLVLLTLTPCSENDDYQPETFVGGIAGAARMYTHAMMKATFPCARMEAGFRVTRPTTTTITDEKPCGCAEMNQSMRSLLVTDINHEDRSVLDIPPFWDAIFADYWTEPLGRPGGSEARETTAFPIKMTDPERAQTWNKDSGKRIVRGQGFTDNLHMAPRMAFPANIDRVFAVTTPFSPTNALSLTPYKLGELVVEEGSTVD